MRRGLCGQQNAVYLYMFLGSQLSKPGDGSAVALRARERLEGMELFLRGPFQEIDCRGLIVIAMNVVFVSTSLILLVFLTRFLREAVIVVAASSCQGVRLRDFEFEKFISKYIWDLRIRSEGCFLL